jgi:alcohol dehydrogenase
MNAAIYHSFGGPIRVERVPIPPVPPVDGVLIHVQATGICRSDWHGWKGHDDDVRTHGLPFCPGHEFSGIVVQSTSGPFQAGDRVAIPFILSCGSCPSCRVDKSTVCHHQHQPGFTQWGSFAEYVAIPRASRNVKRLPDTVSFLQAAALGCRFTTAYRAVLQQGRLQRNQSVAIFGCGGLGLSCIVMAKLVGANPIVAIDISDQALIKAHELGATHIISGTATNVREQVWTTTDNQGAQLTIDAAGFSATCEHAIYCTRRAGRMVQVGLPMGSSRPPQIPMAIVAGRELELVGSHGFAATDLPTLLDMVSTGKLDPLPLVERCVSLQEGAQILMDMDRTSPLGMIMITNFTTTTTTTTTTAVEEESIPTSKL